MDRARSIWLSLLFAPLILAAEEVSLPELDFVVTVKVTPANVPAAVTEQIQKSLLNDARMIFARIPSPKTSPAEPAKDGAAKYRLFIDYTAAIACGSQFSMKIERGSEGGVNFNIRRWFLGFDQKASYTARLAKWSGEKYTDVLKFGGPVKTMRDPQAAGGMLVAQTSNRAGAATDNDICPITMDEARKKAFQQAYPPSLRTNLLSNLVPVTVAKAAPTKMDGGKPVEMVLDLKFDNKSPWPVKRVEYAFVQAGVGFLATDEKGTAAFMLPEPIAPGKSTTIKGLAKANDSDMHGTLNVEFVTGAQ